MAQTTRRGFLRSMFIDAGSDAGGSKTLVCVFLRGGADTLNMIVPYGDDQYYDRRPNIAIDPPGGGESLGAGVRIDDLYAFHPGLRPLLTAYREGRLAVVQGVGSDNPTGSHFEAQDQVEHGEAYAKTIGSGWLGRYLRSRGGGNSTPLSSIAIGSTIPESLRGAPSASAIRSIDELQIKAPPGEAGVVSATLSKLYGAQVGILSQPGRLTLDLLGRVESLRGREYVTEPGVEYPSNDFAGGLREIARLVKAEVGLEVACVDLGGWDTHFFQGKSGGLQAEAIDDLARSLSAFDADLAGYREKVITVVMTEFGRRIYENASLGTDHGRGFAMMLMGGGVNGGRVHGEWPGLEEPDIPGPGGLKVVHDFRSVLWEILSRRFGCRDLSRVFPGFAPEPIGVV